MFELQRAVYLAPVTLEDDEGCMTFLRVQIRLFQSLPDIQVLLVLAFNRKREQLPGDRGQVNVLSALAHDRTLYILFFQFSESGKYG